ncbi:muramoyltetrapeptide carboxypeptidase [Pedobacter sp. CG_S7]|uniref:S66 peptidase family protein n=1 Tax=Pedobacter sp. CG_S7 TaxID=3143930 RepID=UPI003396A706
MNRKLFLSSLALAGASIPSLNLWATAAPANALESSRHPKIPPYLKKGDTIGITCPAGFITMEEILPSVKLMESWGFQVKIGQTVGAKDFTFGGTVAERAADLQLMMDDKEVKAIMCARGGYGAVSIIDLLDFKHFVSHPKWIIGFSDITLLHCHLNSNFKIASIHSKMCNSFPSEWALADPIQIETILSIRQALAGQDLRYKSPFNEFNRMGEVQGVLIGGNLSIIENLAGSNSDINTNGKILFLEDTGEYLYGIDRMFWNLKRSGKLTKLKGLIIGGFKIKPENEGEEFGKTIEEIVLEKVTMYKYPVCFDFPVGHQKSNFALKCGVKHALTVGKQGSILTSIG